MPTSPAFSVPPAESCSVPAVLPVVQALVVVSGEASVIAPGLVGNTSVKDTPVMFIGLIPGLPITIVTVPVPPDAIDDGLNDFVIVGGAITFNVPLTLICGGVFVVVIVPVTLVYAPATAEDTLTVMSHTPAALIVRPVSESDVPFAAADAVPREQVPVLVTIVGAGVPVLVSPDG